jgi:5-amino-6-(5-phosphoribosylamino)uracil reductase
MSLPSAEAAAHVRIQPAAGERPYVVINMVESVDGRFTVDGHVGALTSPEDQELLHALREQADAVVVGASTVRAEGYSRLLPDEHRERRAGSGRHPEPILCVLSRERGLPVESPGIGGEHRVIVATGATLARLTELPGVDYLRYSSPDGSVPLGELMTDLRERFGVRACVCEGGPEVARELIDRRLCDELFVSVSPKLVGAAGRVGVFAPVVHQRELELRSLLEARGHVFLRYGLI